MNNKELEELGQKLESGEATASDVLGGIKSMLTEASGTPKTKQVSANATASERLKKIQQKKSEETSTQGPGKGETVVVNTNPDAVDGQTKCEKCGSTEISLNVDSGKLRCHWCRHEQEATKVKEEKIDISKLQGQIIGSGASAANFDEMDSLALKCQSCAAEVVIDTTESTQARCHWCRNTLSINNKVPNGAVPDKVLPFGIKKDAAQNEIEKFVSKRNFFAHPKFKAEFTTENIMGVYLPYMVVDANVKAKFSGEGEVQIRTWTETRTTGSGQNKKTITTRYYDADRYSVNRDFDMIVEGLTIESNSEKLKHNSSNRTNNVINAIKPFNLEESRQWDANFMTGYTAQNRDTNVEDLRGMVETKITDIARHQIRDSIKNYDRGVRWKSEKLDVIGKQWKAAYFPVWLYSYQTEDKGIHYVAVNGQTSKTMGSVPINTRKLLKFALLLGGIPGALVGMLIAGLLADPYTSDSNGIFWIAMIICFFIGMMIFYSAVKSKYRNQNARYNHENSTKATIRNIVPRDKITRKLRRTTVARLSGDNSSAVKFKGSQ